VAPDDAEPGARATNERSRGRDAGWNRGPHGPTVAHIDFAGRGRVTQTVYVAPEVKLFEELKTGDKVTVRVLESVIVAARPGLKPNVPVDTTAAAKKSGAAGGDVLQQLKAVVTIESIDLRTQTVTYKGGNNLRVVRP
jgi:hypothetical protein